MDSTSNADPEGWINVLRKRAIANKEEHSKLSTSNLSNQSVFLQDCLISKNKISNITTADPQDKHGNEVLPYYLSIEFNVNKYIT